MLGQIMEENILTIQHKNFDEEKFEVIDAEYNIYQNEDKIWELFLIFDTDKPLKRDKKLESVLNAEPNFGASILLDKNEIKLTENKTFFQKSGYDYEREEYLTNFYYFSHETIENLEVKILEIQKYGMKAIVKGEVIVNDYGSNEPDAQINITANFFLNKDIERDFH